MEAAIGIEPMNKALAEVMFKFTLGCPFSFKSCNVLACPRLV